jgi:hypothetical protein
MKDVPLQACLAMFKVVSMILVAPAICTSWGTAACMGLQIVVPPPAPPVCCICRLYTMRGAAFAASATVGPRLMIGCCAAGCGEACSQGPQQQLGWRRGHCQEAQGAFQLKLPRLPSYSFHRPFMCCCYYYDGGQCSSCRGSEREFRSMPPYCCLSSLTLSLSLSPSPSVLLVHCAGQA